MGNIILTTYLVSYVIFLFLMIIFRKEVKIVIKGIVRNSILSTDTVLVIISLGVICFCPVIIVLGIVELFKK